MGIFDVVVTVIAVVLALAFAFFLGDLITILGKPIDNLHEFGNEIHDLSSKNSEIESDKQKDGK